MKKRWSQSFSLALILMLLITAVPAQHVQAISTGVVISQVYGGGGNSGAQYQNDFIELFNRGTSTVSLSGWSLQYGSTSGIVGPTTSAYQITPLSGSIAPGQYILVQEAPGSSCSGLPCGSPLPTPDITDSTPISMASGGAKVALVNSTTPLNCDGPAGGTCSAAALATIVDFVGWDGANWYEGSGAAPTTSNTTADFRLNGGCTDTDNNKADFGPAVAPGPRNSASPFNICPVSTPPSGSGSATPGTSVATAPVLLTVAVNPGTNPASTGLAVSCNLAGLNSTGMQSFYDDGVNGHDAIANDNTFSYYTTVGASVSAGPISLPCTVSDAQGRSTTPTISLNVANILTIGAVNGPILSTETPATHRSPYAPPSGNSAGTTTIAVQGVIYETTLQAISGSSNSYKGFYIQNTAATADGDPNTSDGLFAFMNTNSTLVSADGPYTPAVGDEVIVSGNISEYYNMTELQAPNLALIKVVRSGVGIDAEVPAVVANPPASLADANRYWELMQGMRVQVPQNSITLGGRNVFSPADAEVWVANPDSTIAQRLEPYTRRAFRDAHPLDDNYDPNNWDGNGYRILMGSLGIKAAVGDAQALIDPARAFETVTNSPSGGLNYTFSKYRIEITSQPDLSLGPDPAANNPPEAIADQSTAYSIVDYNLENLYDYRNNPFSGCDFPTDTAGCSNAGTPFLAPVSSPYDYVPASDAAYQARLNDIALEIINDLHSPDILMVQEVENQDICIVTGGALACGTTDNADGKPDVLQELALKIAANGGPNYDAAFDRNSSDLRGIAPSFMYRTDRVELVPVTAGSDPVLGMNPVIGSYTGVAYNADVSNPKTLNAVYTGTGACETSWVFPRAPDIGLFRIYSTSIGVGSYRDVYVINNHFKSGPDTCVAHRTEQAKFNAALVAYIQAANPYARIVLGGDLNVYPRPDDPFAPIGQPTSSDQLGSLYDPSLGLKNLWEVLLDQAPEAAYSYVYLGMAQTLDQMFVNKVMLADLNQFRIAHINSDFPADYPGDVARGTSDHDPNVATFGINFEGFFRPIDNLPVTNTVKAGQAIPVKFSLGSDKGLDIFAAGYPVSQQVACDFGSSSNPVEETVTAGLSGLSYDPTTDTYTYVWKTDKAWANSCRQLTVMLNDGTADQANFNFTK